MNLLSHFQSFFHIQLSPKMAYLLLPIILFDKYRGCLQSTDAKTSILKQKRGEYVAAHVGPSGMGEGARGGGCRSLNCKPVTRSVVVLEGKYFWS